MKGSCPFSVIVPLLAVALLFGCAGPFGSKIPKTTFGKAGAVLVGRFSSDPQLLGTLEGARSSLRGKPAMAVRSFEDNTGRRHYYQLQTLAMDFRNRVRKTGLLDVKDDAACQEIIDRLNFSANGGLEDNAMPAPCSPSVTPDFVLTGELRRGETEDFSILFLMLHDRSGVLVWSDRALIEEEKD